MSVPNVGDLWRLVGNFYSDPAETTHADPTTVTLTIRDPAGVSTTLTYPVGIVKDGTGIYHYDWTPLVGGVHTIDWHGTGAVQVVEQEGIAVRGVFSASSDLVDLQTVRARLNMPEGDEDKDPELDDLIAAVSAHLMESYEQEWVPAGSAPETREFTYRGGGRIDLSPWSAQAGTITAVSMTPDGFAATALTSGTDWFDENANRWGVVNSLRLRRGWSNYGCLPQTVSVTATWGYPSVPEVVRRAATITVIHWYREQTSRPSGFTEPDEGSLDDRVAIPQRARWMLRPFERLVVV